MRAPIQKKVYIGYWVLEKDRGQDLTFTPFPAPESSLKRAILKVENETAVEFAEYLPGLSALFYLQPHATKSLLALTQVEAFFRRPDLEKDTFVCGVLPVSAGISTIRTIPRTPSRPRKLIEKRFVGFVHLGPGDHCYFDVPATGYMKARELVARFAAAVHDDDRELTARFGIRNQEIADGKTVDDYIHIPWKKSEIITNLVRGEDGEVKATFPGEFQPKFRPNQWMRDQDVFVRQELEELVKKLKPLAESLKRAEEKPKRNEDDLRAKREQVAREVFSKRKGDRNGR